jgi:hypothetical protein
MMDYVAHLARLGEDFDRQRPRAARTWKHVARHAELVWSLGLEADASQRTAQFTDLLFAVGNFKRQTPIDPPDSGLPRTDVVPRDSLQLNLRGGMVELRRDDPVTSCSEIEQIDGIGIATASTVLSALWPDSFVIMDSRTAPVIAALLEFYDVPIEGRPTGTQSSSVDAESYGGWYLNGVEHLAEVHGVSRQSLERGAFLVGPPPHHSEMETWPDYAHRAMQRIDSFQ